MEEFHYFDPSNYPEITTDDIDGDGLSNGAEDPDSDGDGLSDGDEVNTYQSNPRNPDTDGDGLWDGWVDCDTAGLCPGDPGYSPGNLVYDVGEDPGEWNYCSSAESCAGLINSPDGDGDGLPDQDEITIFGTQVCYRTAETDDILSTYNPDSDSLCSGPEDPDSDNDGLDDDAETQGWSVDVDRDGDGVRELTIDVCFRPPWCPAHSHPWTVHTDLDDLDDYQEWVVGTIPSNPDTDLDGLGDDVEIQGQAYQATYRRGRLWGRVDEPLRFGHEGHREEFTGCSPGYGRECVWTLTLVPGPFDPADFLSERDWRLDIGQSFDEFYTFSDVLAYMPEVLFASVSLAGCEYGCSSTALAEATLTINGRPDPTLSDTDLDGINDGQEVNSLELDLRGLPGSDASPIGQDIFVEVDIMNRGPDWFDHTFDASQQQLVINAFVRHGIALHIDDGEMRGGQGFGHAVHTTFDDTDPANPGFPDFYDTKGSAALPNLFNWDRKGMYHYVLFVHHLWRFDADSGEWSDEYGGVGEGSGRMLGVHGGDDILVADGHMGWLSERQAKTFMHELGHNLGLCHPGEGTCPGTGGEPTAMLPGGTLTVDYTAAEWEAVYLPIGGPGDTGGD